MELPKKDKNGNSYLSYSQISLFKRDKEQYYKTYVINEPFKSNEYIEFGNKVGIALEKNNFCDFEERESKILRKVTRLEHFEQPVFLRYENFYVVGYVDTCSSDYTHIIDYKTGGKNKHIQYTKEDYWQLPIYALAIRQGTGNIVSNAQIEFIERSGNLYYGEDLKVSDSQPLVIDIDVSEDRLKYIYWEIPKLASQIEEFYLDRK